MRRLLLLCLLMLAVGVLQVPVRAADPVRAAATPPGDFMGMVARDPHYEWKTNPAYPSGVNEAFMESMGANLKAAGVKWVRIEFFAEENAEPGVFDRPGEVNVEKYRYFVNVVAPKYGLKVLALLATPLVRRPANDTGLTSYPVGKYIEPEELDKPAPAAGTNPVCDSSYGTNHPYMCIWLRNALRIVAEFPYNKATGAGIAAYEVLNEENRYIGGGGKGLEPNSVATLLANFYRVVKMDGSFGPWTNDVSIILGGLHPDRCNDCGSTGMNDRQYLDAVYRSGAFAGFTAAYRRYPLDGVGYHPYPMEMRSGLVPEETAYNDLYRVPARIAAIRQVMTSLPYPDLGNKIWITEIGDRGAPRTVDPAGDNERRQAEFLRTIYWMLWQNRDFVKNVFWFKYEDFAAQETPTGPMNFGVVRLAARPPTQYLPGCTICEYEMNGTVEVFKQSYLTYRNMANTGAGLETYTTFLPNVAR